MTNRSAKVYCHGQLAGTLAETEEGYSFQYDEKYLLSPHSQAISQTMPPQAAPLTSKVLFPFFDGLIPEGWLLDIAVDNWKLSEKDRFGILLTCCQSTIGAVSVISA